MIKFNDLPQLLRRLVVSKPAMNEGYEDAATGADHICQIKTLARTNVRLAHFYEQGAPFWRLFQEKQMSAKIEYSFSTRRDAELAVERLVQEHGFERTDIFIQPQGSDNSVGEEISGSDAAAPLEEERDDAPLETPILVSIDLNDDSRTSLVNDVFSEVGGNRT